MGLIGSILKSVALRKLRKNIGKAEAGDRRAQHALGWNYAHGECVPKDYAEAAKWYRKAAEQGHRGAQLNLGRLCEKGQGVEQDLTEAFKWISLATRPGPFGGFFVADAANQYLPQLMASMTPDQIATGKNLADAYQEDFAFEMLKEEPGKSALLGAVALNHRGVVESLLAGGADVNEKTFEELTPLHYSAARGYKSMVELLLAHKADVNVRDKNGFTPLHYAAGGGHMDVARILLTNGADANAKTSGDGSTPSDLAASGGHHNVLELLNQQGDRDR